MVNWDRISELQAEVGDDGIAEVIEIFLEEMDEGLDELESLVGGTDIADKLHFLKGSAQNLGLDDVSTLCAASEDAIRRDEMTDLAIGPIREALALARSELSALGS